MLVALLLTISVPWNQPHPCAVGAALSPDGAHVATIREPADLRPGDPPVSEIVVCSSADGAETGRWRTPPYSRFLGWLGPGSLLLVSLSGDDPRAIEYAVTVNVDGQITETPRAAVPPPPSRQDGAVGHTYVCPNPQHGRLQPTYLPDLPSNMTVYTTDTTAGVFHIAGCFHLRESRRATTVGAERGRGSRLCQVCESTWKGVPLCPLCGLPMTPTDGAEFFNQSAHWALALGPLLSPVVCQQEHRTLVRESGRGGSARSDSFSLRVARDIGQEALWWGPTDGSVMSVMVSPDGGRVAVTTCADQRSDHPNADELAALADTSICTALPDGMQPTLVPYEGCCAIGWIDTDRLLVSQTRRDWQTDQLLPPSTWVATPDTRKLEFPPVPLDAVPRARIRVASERGVVVVLLESGRLATYDTRDEAWEDVALFTADAVAELLDVTPSASHALARLADGGLRVLASTGADVTLAPEP